MGSPAPSRPRPSRRCWTAPGPTRPTAESPAGRSGRPGAISGPEGRARAVLRVGGQAGQEMVPAIGHKLAVDAGMAEVQLAGARPAVAELEPQRAAGPFVAPGVRHA